MRSWLSPGKALDGAQVERGLRILSFEGMLSQTMVILSTGAFMVGFALALGASNTVIGLLAAIGPLAQIIQLPSIYLVERLRARRVLVVVTAGLSRLLLLPIAALPFFAPPSLSLPLLLGLLACHFALANVAGCAFNSWIRDLVPEERMERFFALRLTLATLVGAIVSFAGGIGVDAYKSWIPDEIGAYAILFTTGAAFGIVSVFLYSRVPEPRMPEETGEPLRSLLSQPFKDRNFRSLLIFLGCWSFAVNLAAPFFAVYLLKRLGLSMTWVLALSVVSQVCNVLFFGVWGRLAERFSNKSVLVFSVPMFFITFLLWPFTTMPDPHVLTVPILIGIHVMAGVSLAGVALCAGNLAFKSAPYGKAGAYLAVNALVSGAAATLAPILAGLAADGFEPYELRVTLTFLKWRVNDTHLELPTIDLRGIDFLFIIAFAFGLYSVHRLLAVKEEGEVADRVLRQAFFAETRRMVRQVSTVAGIRYLVTIPASLLMTLRRRDTP